jgi:hypothetical protein
MCEGTVLPHCGHLFKCGACQRFAALRVRSRILDVLRFGTPMAAAYQSTFKEENNVEALKRHSAEGAIGFTIYALQGSALEL